MTANRTYEIDVEDVEYLRHGDKPLLARMFKPRGPGPFPAIIELHGGAWCLGDRLMDVAINEPLAKSGVVVAALDFRVPPEASYPGSLADINYAIRWFKTQATEFGSRPDLVGALGSSSGAHQAILAGMRPFDARYAALPLPAGASDVDARLRCAVLCWPVIDPLARYHYAKKLKASGQPYPDLVDLVLPLHDKYWKTEEAMAARAIRFSPWNAESRSNCRPRSTSKAPATGPIPVPTSTVLSNTTAKPAVRSPWRCTRTRRKGLLSGIRLHQLPSRPFRKSSPSSTPSFSEDRVGCSI